MFGQHSFLGWILVGLIVGAIAKLLMPGRDPGGFFVTILIGIAGALAAGFLGKLIGLYREPGTGPGWIMSVLGAIVLLAVWRVVNKNRA